MNDLLWGLRNFTVGANVESAPDPEPTPDGLVTVERTCPICRKLNRVTVPADGYRRWKSGTLMQDALPMVSPADREIVMTGVCDEHFRAMARASERDGVDIVW